MHRYTEQLSIDSSARGFRTVTFSKFFRIYPTHWFYPLSLKLLFQPQDNERCWDTWHWNTAQTSALYTTLSRGTKRDNWDVLTRLLIENNVLNKFKHFCSELYHHSSFVVILSTSRLCFMMQKQVARSFLPPEAMWRNKQGQFKGLGTALCWIEGR